MKVNIQKIVYRFFPVLTVLVLLLSCVVVGNSLKAEAAGVLDLNTSWYGTPYFAETEVERLTPRTIDIYHNDKLTSSSDFSYPFLVDASDSFSLFVRFEQRFTKNSGLGNTVEFMGINHMFISSANSTGSINATTNYVCIRFYDGTGVAVGNSIFHKKDGRYVGFLNWPKYSEYFTVEVGLYVNCSNATGDFYFYVDSLYDDVNYPRLASFNCSKYEGMTYYWNLAGDPYKRIFCDLRTEKSWYSLSWSNYYSGQRGHIDYRVASFGFDFDAGDVLVINYDPGVYFDINKFMALSSTVFVDDIKSHYVGSGNGDVYFSPMTLLVDYYDVNYDLIKTQEVICNCPSDNWNHKHAFNLPFLYNSKTQYIKIRLRWQLEASASIAFTFGLNNFYIDFAPDPDLFWRYMNGQWGDDYVLPDIPAGDGPAINPDDFDIDNLVDATYMSALTSAIRELWNCSALTSMLIIVVSLSLVSWIFFGKK